MTSIVAFAAAAAAWHNFYILIGTAAATLIGLMFVAVTFGAGQVSRTEVDSARAFLDPPFTHFVTVLLVGCAAVIPTMGTILFGIALLTVTLLRTAALLRVYAKMRDAHRRNSDLELSDWLLGIVLPLACYVALIVAGVGFELGRTWSFDVLAGSILALLLLGIFGAWELVIWLALTRTQGK